MTLSEWIKEYCEENDITLPDDIPDENTALRFLSLNGSGGGSTSDFELVEVKFVRGTKTGYITLKVPNIDARYDQIRGDVSIATNANEVTTQVVFYKGCAICAPTVSMQLVGDNYDSDESVITGSGTITLNSW